MELIIVLVVSNMREICITTQMSCFFPSLMCLQSYNWQSFVVLQKLLFPHVWHHSVYQH